MKHLALLLAGTAALAVPGMPGHAEDNDWGHNNIKHVRLARLWATRSYPFLVYAVGG